MSTPPSPPSDVNPIVRKSRRIKRSITLSAGKDSLSEPIIDWYHSLRNTSVVILQLHKASKRYFVTATLGDKSCYCFERPQKFHKSFFELNDAIADTVESASSADLASKCLIKVSFPEDNPADLLYVLAVCYGICSAKDTTRMIADNEFFAYALIAAVARKYLPGRDMVERAITPLDGLWKDVYLVIQRTSDSFWEHTLADQTRRRVQALIYKAARDKLEHDLDETKFAPGSPSQLSHRRRYVASAVAWAEVLAGKSETTELANWDKTWHDAWEKEWDSAEDWDLSLAPVKNLKAVSKMLGIIPKMTADGRPSGIAAGRVPMKIRVGPLDQMAESQIPIIAIQSVQESIVEEEREPVVQIHTETTSSPTTEKDTRPKRPGLVRSDSRHFDESNWLSNWCPARYPIEEPIWSPTWETAAEMAWAATWKRAVGYGEKRAQETVEKMELEVRKATSTRAPSKTENNGFEALTRSISRRLSQAPTIIMSSIEGPKRRVSRSGTWLGNGSKLDAISATAVSDTSATATNNAMSSPSNIPVAKTTSISTPSLGRRTSKYGNQLSPSVPEHGEHLADPASDTKRVEIPSKGRLRRVVLDNLAPNTKLREDIHAQLIQTSRSRTHTRFKDKCSKESLKSFLRDEARTGQPSEEELEEQANSAWESAKAAPNSAESNLRSVAENAWLTAMEDHGRLKIQVAMIEDIAELWKKSFEATWERAWKTAWKAAWSSIWSSAWRDAADKGIGFGIQEFTDGDRRLNVPDAFDAIVESQQTFKQVQKIFVERTTYMDSLRTTFSMFKELNRLHMALQNSMPVSHESVVAISLSARNKPVVLIRQAEDNEPFSNQPRSKSHSELQ
ncbi:hypothetical protein BDV93DRAFT_547910 [Ceratobasidium sp. AG-I]|nr:hypothetical protein BDV93DRAFT_547910 [Ceratobasidium sp. AG-I]